MVSETIELRGHIIDSLILPKVLDEILRAGGTFRIEQIKIGQRRADQSRAQIEVSAPSTESLDDLILRLRQHGAEVAKRADVQLAKAPADGVFPHDFYVTTNQQTFVRLKGKEIEVRPVMRDSAIAVDRARSSARAVKFFDARKGDEIVVGHQGIRVVPVQRTTSHTDIFQFINASISADEPKSAVIRELAAELRRARSSGGKIAVVAGPAIVRTGAGEHLERLIELGFVDRLFGGNAFVVFEVDIVLTGSIRDEGPIPGVATDVVEGQKIMRDKLADITHVLLLSTLEHSLAIAAMLGPTVKTVCVDINSAAVDRAVEQQPLRSIGLVTDVEPFLRELGDCLAAESDAK